MEESFLAKFVQSPYALSISFLKEQKEWQLESKDSLGLSRWELNLDEDTLAKFFERLSQMDIHHSHCNEEEKDSD